MRKKYTEKARTLTISAGKVQQCTEEMRYIKEGYAIVTVFDQINHFLLEPSLFLVLTDHRKVLNVLALLALLANSPWYILSKIHRLEIYFSCFDFVMLPIEKARSEFEVQLPLYSTARWPNRITYKNEALYKSTIPGV